MKAEVKRILKMIITLSKLEMEAEVVINLRVSTLQDFESILTQVSEQLEKTGINYKRLDGYADIDYKSDIRKKITYTY